MTSKREDASKQSYLTVKSKLTPSVFSKEYLINSFLSNTVKAVVSKIVKNRCGLSVLDVGCGLKPYKAFFGNTIDRYVGLDLSKDSNADVIGAGGNFPIKDESFDIVVSFQVLEHVSDPMAVLKELNRVSKSSGFLVLSTHGIYLEEHGPNDLWRWTSRGLFKLAEASGFGSIKIYSMSNLESIIQLLLYYVFIPDNMNIIALVGNLVGRRFSKTFSGYGPKIHLIHLILAKKKVEQND